MATQLNLANLTEKDAYIQKVKTALEQGTGQKIVIINVDKIKRVSGVSARPIEFIFLGNQRLVLFIRAGADAFKATLNGKNIVLQGDFSNDLKMTFDNGVKGVSNLIRDGQKKFEASLLKEKVKPTSQAKAENTPRSMSVTSQIKQSLSEESQIDQDIADKIQQIEQVKSKIAQANIQNQQHHV